MPAVVIVALAPMLTVSETVDADAKENPNACAEDETVTVAVLGRVMVPTGAVVNAPVMLIPAAVWLVGAREIVSGAVKLNPAISASGTPIKMAPAAW